MLNDKRQFTREMREKEEQDAKELIEKLRKAAITLSVLPQDNEDELDVRATSFQLFQWILGDFEKESLIFFFLFLLLSLFWGGDFPLVRIWSWRTMSS